MTKKEIYRLRGILEAMKHNRMADTSPEEKMDKSIDLQEEGIRLCNKTLNKLKP